MKKDLKLKSRDLDDALENIDYKKIMDSVCAKYSRSVDPDDISSLRLEILWKCLKSFDEDIDSWIDYWVEALNFIEKVKKSDFN